jgi:hypothetical protein
MRGRSGDVEIISHGRPDEVTDASKSERLLMQQRETLFVGTHKIQLHARIQGNATVYGSCQSVKGEEKRETNMYAILLILAIAYP